MGGSVSGGALRGSIAMQDDFFGAQDPFTAGEAALDHACPPEKEADGAGDMEKNERYGQREVLT